jgi:hypothetical protein
MRYCASTTMLSITGHDNKNNNKSEKRQALEKMQTSPFF